MPDEFIPENLCRHSIYERRSLVETADFARLSRPGCSVDDFIASLPDILAGRDFKTLLSRLRKIRDAGGPIVMAMGAHVIKCGLSPVVIDLIRRGIITAVATNGAGAVHDWEVAFAGATSEDVAVELPAGRFGMTRETAVALAESAARARREGAGLGETIGREIVEQELHHRAYSILAAAVECDIPVTVHVAVGTDVVHMHPEADGADVGAATMTDFRKICSVVSTLAAGAWVNVGSAVILPEIFLKAVAAARNIGVDLDNMFTANLDMFDLYRPRTNVVNRPCAQGITIIGRHEILMPLLRLGLVGGLGEQSA